MSNNKALEYMEKGFKVYNQKHKNIYFYVARIGEVKSDFGDKFTYEEWLKATEENEQEYEWNIAK